MRTKTNRLDKIARDVGNTPLSKIIRIPVPNGNKIFAKAELSNPTGSHYDRIYLKLFRALERDGKITPGRSRLIETTSGCAGTSFAWFCRELGYPCKVIIPADSPESRKEIIRSYGADIILSPAGEYIRGAIQKLVHVLKNDRDNNKEADDRLILLNHAEDFRSIEAMHAIAAEACEQNETGFDYFIGVCGNGASLLGIGAELKRFCPNLQVISCDPIEAPVSFRYKYGYKEMWKPAFNDLHKHDVYGAGAWGVNFSFLSSPLFRDTVDEVLAISKFERQQCLTLLHECERVLVGRSSAMALAAALRLCETVRNKNILIIFYDSYQYYF